MAHQKGSTAIVGIGYETTFGTAVTTGFTLPVNSCTVSRSFTRNTPATLQGNRNAVEPFAGNTEVGGSIVIPMDNEVLWYWLKGIFGAPTTTGAADPYTHVFKVAATQPSMTIQKGFTDLATDAYMVATGCKVSRIGFEFGGDGELTASLDVIGSNETIAESTAFSVSSTALTLTERYSNLHASIKEGGSTSSIVKSVSINVDFGLDTEQRVIAGGGILGSLPEGTVSVTGNIKALFQDTTILSKGLNDTESSLEVILTPADADHTFSILVPELMYSYKSPEISGPNGLDVDLDFAAYYANNAAASIVVCTLKNASAHA